MSLLTTHRMEPQSGKPNAMVVFLHGYGANGPDLLAIGREWRAALPQAVFIAPDAPRCVPAQLGNGFEWFALTIDDRDNYWRGVNEAAPLLHKYLDDELARYGLFDGRLALVGFSQGTMMALHVGLRRAAAPAALIGYSGVLAGPQHLLDEISARPPVLLVHGAQDDVIPLSDFHLTRDVLQHQKIELKTHISAQMGHGIDGDGVTLGGEFLASKLA